MPYRYTSTATLSDDTELPITEGRISLDESWSPYATGLITVPFTETTPLDALDPRAGNRVLITVTEDYNTPAGMTRTHDLTIRSRTIQHEPQTIDLELASDEAFLFDKRRLGTTPDKTARQHEGSVRAICQWALDKIGATLAPGFDDADMTARWGMENLVTNPRGMVDTAGWTTSLTGGVAGTLGRIGTTIDREGAPLGQALRLLVTTTGTGNAMLRWIQGQSQVAPGRIYTFSAWVATFGGTAPTGTGSIIFSWANAAGTRLTGADVTVQTELTQGIWTKISATAVAPAFADTAMVYVGCQAGRQAGADVRVSGVVLSEGIENDRWFDGSRPAEPGYTYTWSSTPNGSISRRVANPELLPELYSWKPGQSLWDFLRPFLEGSGLRLFCDDQRVWRLINPAGYQPDVTSAIITYAQPGNSNTKDATDTISLDADEYATGVVVQFQWIDRDGTQRTAYDAAGTDEKVLLIERETPPVAGAAASILSSLAQAGNTQNVTALIQIDTAYPSNLAAVELPGTVRMVGSARSVSIDLASGLIDISTRNMHPAPL